MLANDINWLKTSVNCPFSKKSIFWNNKFQWNTSQTIQKNVENFLTQDFNHFIEAVKKEKEKGMKPTDVIALSAPGNIYGSDIETFSEFFRQVIFFINKKSLQELAGLQADDEDGLYLDNGWQFEFNEIKIFIITFAPFYKENHSRYSYGNTDVILLFQPEFSFKYFLPKDKATKERLKEKIRNLFKQKGQSYYNSKIFNNNPFKKTHEAPRYIKPLNALKDPVVEWWVPNKKIHFQKQKRKSYCKEFCTIL